MNSHLDPETEDYKTLVEYDLSIRAYRFILLEAGKDYGIRQALFYCPWCGKKLPETLGDEWEEILKKEYNLTINNFFDKKGRWDELKIPEELRTDEWWKKRNL